MNGVFFSFLDILYRISLVKKVAVLTEKRAWENLLYLYSHNSFWFQLGIKSYQKKKIRKPTKQSNLALSSWYSRIIIETLFYLLFSF